MLWYPARTIAGSREGSRQRESGGIVLVRGSGPGSVLLYAGLRHEIYARRQDRGGSQGKSVFIPRETVCSYEVKSEGLGLSFIMIVTLGVRGVDEAVGKPAAKGMLCLQPERTRRRISVLG